MSVRDDIAKTIVETELEPSQNPDVPGFIMGGEVLPSDYIEEIADAIIARFPYITADQSLYDYAASLRQQLLDTRAELEKTKRGARTLGQIIEQQATDALNATGLHHLIDETGDGDWGAVWENLAELGDRARRAEAALSRSDQ